MNPLAAAAVLTVAVAIVLAATTWSGTVAAETVDVLIRNGRVIDPESGLDAVRDVAINDGKITHIASHLTALRATTSIDATGRVVAPGFIDLHEHGQSERAHEYQARDGVTTSLELECGYPDVASFLESRRGKSRVNYGASVSHGNLRALALADQGAARDALRAQLRAAVQSEEPLFAVDKLVQQSAYAELDAGQQKVVAEEIRSNLAHGALGIGMFPVYYPGADRTEIYAVFELAAAAQAPIFIHVRGRPGLEGIQEAMADAAATGAPLHIVHINSVSLGAIGTALSLIHDARGRGLDVTTEAYPYTAASTDITASFFDEDGWQQAMSYSDLQWQDTGERLNAETFARYRKQGGVVIMHLMKEPWIEQALGNDWVMVASDGMPYAPGAHPRGAGTFARVLGHYVRERRVIDLPTALRKMTLLPAQRLEAIAPQMAHKGRVRIGADADLVVFDPVTVIDTATFESGPSFSKGIDYVFVAGVAVVAGGESVADVFPGAPVEGRTGI